LILTWLPSEDEVEKGAKQTVAQPILARVHAMFLRVRSRSVRFAKYII